MSHPLYMRWFSTGDLITLAAAVITVAVAWGSMSSQMTHQGEQIEAMRQQISDISKVRITPDADARLRVLEAQQIAAIRDRDEMKVELTRRLEIIEAQNREILQRLPKR